MSSLAALYLLVVNAAAFAAFGLDKQAARTGARRTPERALLLLALAGGGGGAVGGQQLFRHKTRKEPFRTLLWAITAAEALGLAWMLGQG